MGSRTDLIEEFIRKLDIFIFDCEKISHDQYLMENIDGRTSSRGRISVYHDRCFLYLNSKETLLISWNDIINEMYFYADMSGFSFRRNELDPVLLCLEQPKLRKINDGILSTIVGMFDKISEEIKFYES